MQGDGLGRAGGNQGIVNDQPFPALALTLRCVQFVLDLLDGQMWGDLHGTCHRFFLTACQTPRHACYHTWFCLSEVRLV
jgi:hypothetical protein